MSISRFCCCLLLTLSGISCAPKGDPAGILLYSRHQGEIHLLVANDAILNRGWSGFGGTAKPGEGTALTAARETSEETRGYFEQDWLLRQIVGTHAVEIRDFHLYFAEVPHVPVQRIMEHPVAKTQAALLEFHPFAWIPFSEIDPLLSRESWSPDELRLHPRHLQGSENDSYWPVWLVGLREAQRQGRLPWER